MADKSLFDIAKELYQGFGNNPANRELANTLTFRAPVVRELNPLVTIPRGINTLRDTDYGALKDLLLGKYQIADNPKASLQRSGKALMNVGEGALDAAPVLGLVKPTIAGAKMAAPHLAEAGVRQLNKLEQKYGLPTGLQMNIVPPEGNLNLTTRLDEQIKGPETQTVFDLLKQLKGKPGVTKEGLKKIAEKYPDSAAKVNKEEFKKNIPRSAYEKVDLKQASLGDIEHYLDEAMEQMTPHDAMDTLGVPKRYQNDALMLEYGDIEFHELDPDSQRVLGQLYGIDSTMSPDDIRYGIEQINMDAWHEAMYDRAEVLRAEGADDVANLPYPYEGVQRLVHSQPKDSYFEFGVTHPEQREEYRHYRSEHAPEGLIGHVRGSYLEEPTAIEGGVQTKPNSYIVEEIQSDAQKGEDQVGHLHQVHGTLTKAAIQDAIERGAEHVYFPTSYPIGSTRGRPAADYAAIYDQAVHKEALNPISQRYGVQLEPQMSKAIFPAIEPTVNPVPVMKDVPFFHRLELTPEFKQEFSEEGFQTPGYAAGGLVSNDYDDEHIEQLSEYHFGKGGDVSVEPHENEYVTKAARYGRKGQYQMANLIGIKPEVKFATEIPERYYPANEQHNARGDAMRHILLQAQLANRSPFLAKAVGWAHENLSGPQGDAEKAMDKYNDELGRQIGITAKDKADMVWKAMQAIESGKAKTLTKEQMGEGYAQGGLVYNDEEINNLANQLFGA